MRRVATSRRAAALLLAGALVSAPAAVAQDAPEVAAEEEADGVAFEPLLLDGGTSLDVDADPDLDLGESGTVEFWVAAIWDDEDGVEHHPCIIGRRTRYEGDEPEGFAGATRFSIHITPERDAIGMFDGRRWASVPFDFGDGRLHHVAFGTEGARTRVYIDGSVRGTLEIGYGTGPELPLHIGSADGASEFFVGSIASVRLWRGVLGEAQLRELADLIGPPDDDHPAAPSLVAFSEFTTEAKTLVILGTAESAAP